MGIATDSSSTAILHRNPWRPATAVSARGIYITLEDGTELMDGVGGAAVNCIGSGDSTVNECMKEQIDKMSYVYNVQLSNPAAEALAKRLVASGEGAFEKCVFVAGGSEAMEAAIKLARQYWWEISQPQRKHFITRKLSYYGNTLGCLALGYHPARRAPYEALLEHTVFHHVGPAYYKRFALEGESEEEYVDRLAKELEAKFQELGPENVAAFVAEPVVGATQGVTRAPKGYFAAVSEICKRHGALLIWDEIMCGMGRMGQTVHAWQNPNSYTDGISPDIQTVAKGLGSGYAVIGAVLMNSKVANAIQNGSNWLQHGHTYQAHPLACAASLAVQNVIQRDHLLEKCATAGTYIEAALKEGLTGPNAIASPYVFDIRGGGCFWGIEFEFSEEESLKWFSKQRFGSRVQAQAMKLGLVIIGMSGGVDGKKGDHLIIAPAYNITKEEIAEVVRRTVSAVEICLKSTVLNLE